MLQRGEFLIELVKNVLVQIFFASECSFTRAENLVQSALRGFLLKPESIRAPRSVSTEKQRLVLRATALSLVLLWTSPILGQKLSLGVIGGAHLNDDFRSRPDIAGSMRQPPTTFFVSRTSSSFTPMVGPKVEIDFAKRWSDVGFFSKRDFRVTYGILNKLNSMMSGKKTYRAFRF